MNKVAYFEFDVENPDRAGKFYANVFGWKISTWGEKVKYWLITTDPKDDTGIDGSFMLRSERDEKLRKLTVNSIDVSSIDEYIKKIEDGGGKIVTPKIPITGEGYVVYFKDTEKNIFGIYQDDVNAK